MTRAEILNCLTDRPCDYCRFHESGRCERWNCVFEEKPDDVEDCEDTINRQAVLATLDDTDKFMDEDRTVENYKALLKECYEVLPSVTPKVAECEDAISRADAIDVVHEYFEKYLKLNDDICLDGIRSLPSVTPQETETEYEEIDFVQEHKKIPITLDLTPTEDAISRQAVLTYIECILTHGMGKKKSFEFIKKYVEKQSPATSQPKMGRWIHFAWSDDCSECGWSTGKYESPTNYCPNCGAKMVEPQESER